jgi:hypothetical protein
LPNDDDIRAVSSLIRWFLCTLCQEVQRMADDARAGRTIEIPKISLARLVVTIVGETPLITHRFGERARKQIEEKQQHAPRSARPPRDPEAEFRDALFMRTATLLRGRPSRQPSRVHHVAEVPTAPARSGR